MKSILFNFNSMGAGKDKAIREVTRLFKRAGANVVKVEVAPQPAKKAGIAYRNVDLTFADGQTVTMAVKETGDIFEVRINKTVVPVRTQEDAEKAIGEIAGQLDKRRSAFQRALARVRVALPPSVRVNRKTMIAAKVAKRDGLREAVSLAEQELAELTGVAAA